jgi:hypothetical protein
MDIRASDASERPKRSRLTLWLILATCAAPIIASYAAYYFWTPSAHVNYGELIAPHPLPDAPLAALDGRVLRLAQLKGQWTLMMAAPATCDERCRRNLVYMRQVRLAQGREAGRIERVWLVTGAGNPDPALVAEHPGLHIARGEQSAPGEVAAAPGQIHVVDPLGNLMMRFPADPDPRRMLKDLARLLRHSKWK